MPTLLIEADLTLENAGDTLRVVSRGDLLVVEAPTSPAALRLARSFRAAGDATGGAARVLELVSRTGVDAEVRVRGRAVARVGPSARPRWPFRYGPVQLYPLALGTSWFGR